MFRNTNFRSFGRKVVDFDGYIKSRSQANLCLSAAYNVYPKRSEWVPVSIITKTSRLSSLPIPTTNRVWCDIPKSLHSCLSVCGAGISLGECLSPLIQRWRIQAKKDHSLAFSEVWPFFWTNPYTQSRTLLQALFDEITCIFGFVGLARTILGNGFVKRTFLWLCAVLFGHFSAKCDE